jgi:hypothetical protein
MFHLEEGNMALNSKVCVCVCVCVCLRVCVYGMRVCVYCMHLYIGYIVDAMFKGNASRFMNHSSDPNCYCQVV